MMNSKKLLLCSVVLVALAPVFVSAQGGGHRGGMGGMPYDSAYDTNGDGTVSSDEMTTARTAEFQAIDTDSSGTLTLAEIKTWVTAQLKTSFTALDTDSSGSLTVTEMVGSKTGRQAKFASKAFAISDSNSDGLLSLDEFSASNPEGNGKVMHISMLDTDDDDLVSLTEYLTKPGRGEGFGGHHGGPMGRF